MMLAIVIILFFVLLFLGAPVAMAMGISCMPWLLFGTGTPGTVVAQKIFSSTNSFSLMAIPFFMMAGSVMEATGITKNIVKFANSLVGHFRGGLAQTTTVTGTIMAGISGSANADCAAIANLMVPAMKDAGYDEGYAVVCTATAGGLGPIIPPSIQMVIFASITGFSTGKLFMGGVLPGFVAVAFYMVMNYLYARVAKVPIQKFKGFKYIWKSFKETVGALIMPLIIVGGIVGGIFTATEAGVAAVVYGIIYGFVTRRLTVEKLFNCLKSAVVSTAGPMLIIAVSSILSYVLTRLNLTTAIESFCASYIGTPVAFLFFVIIVNVIAGCFIDGNATMLMLVPILFPVAQMFGISEIQFALIFIVSMLTGGITPPVGIFLFIVSGVEGTPLSKCLKWVLPFFAMQILLLILMVFFPGLTTWLPSIMA